MVADRRETKALALKRARDAEMAAVIQEQALEATHARKAEYNSYRVYLDGYENISDQQRSFLAHLALNGTVYQSCIESGTPSRTHAAWLQNTPGYRELVDECKKLAGDRLERVAIGLATGEYMRPLVSQGRVAAYEKIYDTKALITLLKKHKPSEFGDRIDITSNGHSIVKLVDKEAWDAV